MIKVKRIRQVSTKLPELNPIKSNPSEINIKNPFDVVNGLSPENGHRYFHRSELFT